MSKTSQSGAKGGSKLSSFADAIAKAEGYNVAGSLPNRNNNPGDLTKDFTGTGIGSDQGKVTFATPLDGWNSLMHQLGVIAGGVSHAGYDLTKNFFDFAGVWVNGAATGRTAESDNWAKNVAGALGVDPNTSVGDYLGG